MPPTLEVEAEAALPATPQTLQSDKPMDSDDDVNSVMSGSDDGFGEDQDSSVDFGAGKLGLGHFDNRHVY